jgi:hypothetical protein
MTNLQTFIPPDYIGGLVPRWTSPGTNANNLIVSSGEAYVPGVLSMVESGGDLSPPSNASLAASTWYYLYWYRDTNGDAQVELSTTAPAASYRGTARTKAGDITRRYIGEGKTNASGALYPFIVVDGVVHWLADVAAAPFLVYNTSVSTTPIAVDCSAVMPPTATVGLFQGTPPSGIVSIGHPDQVFGAYGPHTMYQLTYHGGDKWVPVSSTQTVEIVNDRAGSMILHLMGYQAPR